VSNTGGGFDVYDLRTHLPVQSLPIPGNVSKNGGQSSSARPVVFAHNGRSLIGGTDFGDLLLWDVENGINFQTLHHGSSLALISNPPFFH
jgi:hypothetical protein